MTAAAQVVSGLQHVVSRTVDPIERAVVSVTQIHAGTADNIIPESVELRGTVRTFSPEVRATVREAMERFARGIAEAHGCTSTFEYEEVRLVRQRPRGSRARRGGRARELGDDAFFVPPPIMGGEDFSAYLNVTPGAFSSSAQAGRITTRITTRASIGTSAMRNGIAVFVRLALSYLHERPR